MGSLFAAGTIALLSQTPIAIKEAREISYHRPPNSPVVSKNVDIIFGGDMMFDRSVRQMMEKEGGDFIFSCIADRIQSVDLVVANLEGPITNTPSMSVGSVIGSPQNFTFTFPPETAPLLKRHNIGLVNLGNNHILNFGDDGVEQTKKYLDAAGVNYFGDPHALEEDRVARTTIKDVHFSFVNWSEWTPVRKPSASNGAGELSSITEQIKKESDAGRVTVVYTHWGEEYVPATERQKRLAHAFVDAGADIVIGSHPHVVQEHELYKGTHIYYSLGNFVFDQFWEEAVHRGLLLDVEFNANGVLGVTEIPIDIGRDRRPCVL